MADSTTQGSRRSRRRSLSAQADASTATSEQPTQPPPVQPSPAQPPPSQPPPVDPAPEPAQQPNLENRSARSGRRPLNPKNPQSQQGNHSHQEGHDHQGQNATQMQTAQEHSEQDIALASNFQDLVATLPASVQTALTHRDEESSELYQMPVSVSPYLQFYHHNSPSRTTIVNALGKEPADGQPLFVDLQVQDVILLETLEFHTLLWNQNLIQQDSSGNVLAVSENMQDAENRQEKWRENIDSVILVYLPNGEIAPARGTFRTTKCGCIKTAIAGRREANTPNWSTRSPAHAIGAPLPEPWMRFYCRATLASRRGKNGTYVEAQGVIEPITAERAYALAQCLQDPERSQILDACIGEYEQRLEMYEALGD